MTRVKNNNENIMRYNYEDNIYYSFKDKEMDINKNNYDNNNNNKHVYVNS